ncbi:MULTISPECIES: SDR family oxidoreductase [Rhizobium]|jgi:gluconate 5-dehydrogenase|uniref:Gluconate 5-dehydrogenase n=1 Tax=Rhizobium laguerreae TaxID=1076926 RepID=A0AAX2QDV5_9HYPH|nr:MULTISPECIES: SDR family oxidoreductase [Rhizobium]MBY3168723.1 SDR family oxidoreductase [Rhizobium laguerreae]MBY3243485.1 SDR family oxidoreductase [Rhizobium laguerreae]MBY3304686.1 SDR family oxidoreductase [Rhizobium laguerreae]MBY3526735.1 SDR family oxidoreductase [Rhizobium laguerreae]MBY5649912.1 SDR family oxidoreductase [Rhizobium leguminosarum]
MSVLHNASIFDLTGKTALVTGSSQGIGLALAKGLAQHGAKVVLNGRNSEKLDAALTQLKEEKLLVEACSFDVTDAQSSASGVAQIETSVGPIDILINNAGMQFRTALEDFPIEKWEELFRTNVSSAFYVSRAVVRGMIERGQGKIINIASVQSELARPGIAPYTATKGAIRNLTKGMCTDWAKHGLQINSIAPGYFKTPLNAALVESAVFSDWLQKRTPAGRWGEVDELVGAAVFLSSAASSFINGHTLYVDGGITASL